MSGIEAKSFLNRSPDKISGTIGHWRCLAKRRAAHISSSVWMAPMTRRPFLALRIIFKTSIIWPVALLKLQDCCIWIYLVNGSALVIQKSKPFKQLDIHLLGLLSSGSLKGQLICTGPDGVEVAQYTAESRVVSTIFAGIWSVGAGRSKKYLTKEPKWLTWHRNSRMCTFSDYVQDKHEYRYSLNLPKKKIFPHSEKVISVPVQLNSHKIPNYQTFIELQNLFSK